VQRRRLLAERGPHLLRAELGRRGLRGRLAAQHGDRDQQLAVGLLRALVAADHLARRLPRRPGQDHRIAPFILRG
jgi:hypothetical protein